MTHVVLLNLVLFIVPMCGATAFALFVYHFLKSGDPPEPTERGGGSKVRLPAAGPDDLSRSA